MAQYPHTNSLKNWLRIFDKILKQIYLETQGQKVESFRFEDDNGHEYKILFKVSARVLKKDTPESFILPFFTKKAGTDIFILKEVKPLPDSKMIKRLSFDNLFPPLRHSR